MVSLVLGRVHLSLIHISSKYIYNNYKKLKEGEMTKVRAEVVCEASLYKVAKAHNFSDFILIGKSEANNNGNHKPCLLYTSRCV